MSKIIEFGPEARQKLVAGIDQMADAVVSTLGPNGRNVVISKPGQSPQSTKDGVTVAKSISLEDPTEELGVQMLKQAAIKTADKAGDGTTTSTLLAREMVKAGLSALDNDRYFLLTELDKTYFNLMKKKLGNDLFSENVFFVKEDQF